MGTATDKKSGVFYYGVSMLRTFTPGDTLVLEEKPFAQLLPGDVIAVFDRNAIEPGVIHRVISADGAECVTMGDNNARPDEKKVTSDSRFMLCTGAFSSDGKFRKISGGRAGMLKFRINRFRRACRNFIAPAARKILSLMLWRITLERAGRFADGSTCYYFRKHYIARRTASGIVYYKSDLFKLFFKLPEDRGNLQ